MVQILLKKRGSVPDEKKGFSREVLCASSERAVSVGRDDVLRWFLPAAAVAR
jgi:hypothetical protein